MREAEEKNAPPRILILHNRYQWRGGEDAVVADEVALLRAHGHDVTEHIVDNQTALDQGRWQTIRALIRSAWSQPSYDGVRAMLARVQPDIVHVHNFWFRLTPAALGACHDAGVPVVLTLHNFRLLCPAGVLIHRRGHACMACVGHHPWRGVIDRCYHNSVFASAAVARMITTNRRRKTWQTMVDRFIVPSEFSRDLLIRGGLPAAKICVKPNFISPPTESIAHTAAVDKPSLPRVIFVGRLAKEKGLITLLTAWREVSGAAELRIIGDGPLRDNLERMAAGLAVSFAGHVDEKTVQAEIAAATILVLPSECYETFGRVIVEAYACRKPVVVSRIGGPAELVQEGKTGRLFTPGQPAELAATLKDLLHDPAQAVALGEQGEKFYQSRFTPAQNYVMLREVYDNARVNSA